VKVAVLDVGGRVVHRPLDAHDFTAGEHQVPLFDPENGPLPTGIYFFTVWTPHGTASGRFVVLR
jgi:hypothetical protein